MMTKVKHRSYIQLTKTMDDFSTTEEYNAFIEGDDCGYKRAKRECKWVVIITLALWTMLLASLYYGSLGV